jgi:L-alanine-DL-glutamate epimerase-like enolase superfamily enzyme
MRERVQVERLEVAAYAIPTDQKESDGTLEWDETVMVTVHAAAGGRRGLGWTYADVASAKLVANKLRDVVVGRDALDVPGAFDAMGHAVRNLGRPGICGLAISAVDTALWDLKARLLDVSLADLFGSIRARVPLYGSGGFCSYTDAQLREQLGGWAAEGMRYVKMKVGREPERDPERVRAARAAIGEDCQLFVDGNGAYSRKQARAIGRRFWDEADVRWFEEPISPDDLTGMRALVDALPMDVSAGEYGFHPAYFRRMLQARAVDVLQADCTRCGGYSGFREVGAMCNAWPLPLSTHCAPSLHVHAACGLSRVVHMEWFHDHVRIERMLLDGWLSPRDGQLEPDRTRPGNGYALKTQDAERFRTG